jgi:serine/threonine-protein kinase HipA
MTARVKRLAVATTQGEAGELFRESQFVFRYRDEALLRPDLAISLTMPPRPDGYNTNQLTPVLAMNLPEGFLRDRILERYGKTADLRDDMNLLAISSTRHSGRVWAHDGMNPPAPSTDGLRLKELLAAKGTEKLFDELLERFAMRTMISGIQPKVVAPIAEEASPGSVLERPTIKSPDLIIKAASAEWPGLPENEFYCMSIARAAGIEVPEFWLSDDRSLFLIRRFDLRRDGTFVGFEDIASLTGRHPSKKYNGNYAQVAQAVADFCAAAHRASSLDRFFRQLVLCCLLENGDAHLKNWGVVYGDPVSANTDARLSPAFDIVCTTAFIPADRLALNLDGTKAWPDRASLERFGRDPCGISNPGEAIEDVVEAAVSYTPAESTPMWEKISEAMQRQRPVLMAGSSHRARAG